MSREISYKRRHGDTIVDWKLVLDDEGFFISHNPVGMPPAEETKIHLARRPPPAARMADPEKVHVFKVKRQFLNMEAPCFFHGCAELRKELEDRIAKAKASEECPSDCTLNGIKGDYAMRAWIMFSNDPSAQPPE